MLLILRHTISSLVPRQSRPLQNVNTTSVTANTSGDLFNVGDQYAVIDLQQVGDGKLITQLMACGTFSLKRSSSQLRSRVIIGNCVGFFCTISRQLQRTSSQTGRYILMTFSVSSLVDEPHDTVRRGPVFTLCTVFVRPEDNLESFPRHFHTPWVTSCGRRYFLVSVHPAWTVGILSCALITPWLVMPAVQFSVSCVFFSVFHFLLGVGHSGGGGGVACLLCHLTARTSPSALTTPYSL